MNPDRQTDIRETPALLITALRQFTRLMQDELTLAKAELSRNLSRAGVGIALIGVAAILALTALDVLAGAVVAYLASTDMSVGTAAIIVGGALLIVAIILVLLGKSRISADALAPNKTVQNLRTDIEKVKEASNA